MYLTWRKYFFSSILALVASISAASSSVGADDLKPTTIRVLTYNVQFLPGLASVKNQRPQPEYRTARIAKEISQYDIVGLQETFHDIHRSQIVDHLGEHWKGGLHLVTSPTPEGFLTSGGCLIATRLSIIGSRSTVYKNFSKPADYGFRADGFAAKGVIHARISRTEKSPEDFFDLFVTHLEARDDDLRPLQYAEMANFIKASSDPNRPAIVLGDMNTQGAKQFRSDKNSQYSQLLSALGEARPESVLIDVWPSLKGDALGGTNEQESQDVGKRIDYIFVINPPEPSAQLQPISIAVRLFRDPKVFALSDHNAVEAELEWSYPSKQVQTR